MWRRVGGIGSLLRKEPFIINQLKSDQGKALLSKATGAGSGVGVTNPSFSWSSWTSFCNDANAEASTLGGNGGMGDNAGGKGGRTKSSGVGCSPKPGRGDGVLGGASIRLRCLESPPNGARTTVFFIKLLSSSSTACFCSGGEPSGGIGGSRNGDNNVGLGEKDVGLGDPLKEAERGGHETGRLSSGEAKAVPGNPTPPPCAIGWKADCTKVGSWFRVALSSGCGIRVGLDGGRILGVKDMEGSGPRASKLE